jgi:hypothetical protein
MGIGSGRNLRNSFDTTIRLRSRHSQKPEVTEVGRYGINSKGTDLSPPASLAGVCGLLVVSTGGIKRVGKQRSYSGFIGLSPLRPSLP